MPVKILLIEDSPDHTLFTRRALNKGGLDYELDCVADAQEGAQKACGGDYQCILCDYRLPGMSALEILRSMRGCGKDAPFVVITSSGSEKIAVELMKEGAADYLIKDESYEDTLPMVVFAVLERYKVFRDKARLERELKDSHEKLKEMYAVKSDFTSMVSHELRTPLTAIKEGIAIVLDGSAGELNGQQRDFLSIAKKNVDRLNRLINDVLDFSKLESKRMPFNIRLFPLSEVIGDVVGIQGPVAREKGLDLKTDVAADIPPAEFDPDRINQVLSNLVSNAVKFTERGSVIIAARRDDTGGVIVAVTDTGEGIKEEDIPKLFQNYQQLQRVNRHSEGGTGLGLAICKQIVEAHGGRIWCESQYGTGTTFAFSLPLTSPRKVLVIDDEEIVLDTCEKLLKLDGYVVLRSGDGIKGIQIAETEKPDLVLLDIRLKDINGYEVIGRLRSGRETRDIPILVITGYEEEAQKVSEYKDTMALPCLAKPFDAGEFRRRVGDLIVSSAKGEGMIDHGCKA